MKTFLRLLFLVSTGAPVCAQQVVFHDGFESGLSSWTAGGLWNLEDSSDPCGSQAAPFLEGTKAAWFGEPGSCTYDMFFSGPEGSLTLNSWIALPDAPSISLRFWSFSHTEYCAKGYDRHWVEIEAQNGPDQGFTQLLCPPSGPPELLLPWHERRIDLSAYRGAQVRVRFTFIAGDSAFNDWLGWLVDDVSIIAEPGERICPSAGLASGCPCMPAFVPVAGGCRNSTEQSATLLSGGTPSVAQDTLVFTASHMPSGTLPTLFQGTIATAPAAFGDGLRCIGGAQLRLGTLHAQNGIASWPAAGTPSLSVKGLVPPAGGTRYYQVIYRNAASYCTSATFNLTDAERIVWSP
jgi:hypothetical protein